MPVPISLALAADGVPIVLSGTARDTRFPTPNLIPVNQRVFRADTATQERWTGSAWVVDTVSPAGLVPTGRPAGLTLAQYTANNALFNVMDFGAKGDGATDDSVAIQAAITAAGANASSLQGAVVYFPGGRTYLHTQTLQATVPNLHFYGPSLWCLYYGGASGTYAINADQSGNAPAYTSFSATNMLQYQVGVTHTAHALKLNRNIGGRFEHCGWSGWNRGVEFNNDSNLNVFTACTWASNTASVLGGGVGSWASNTFVTPVFNGNLGTCYDASASGAGNVFLGGDFEPGNVGPVIKTGVNESWTGVRVERNQNGTDWVLVSSGCIMEMDVHASGGYMPSGGVVVNGANNRITIRANGVTAPLRFAATSTANQVTFLGGASLLSTATYFSDLGTFNTIRTPLGTFAKGKSVSDVVGASRVPAALTSWTASHCAISANGSLQRITADGTGVHSVSTTVTGTFSDLFVCIEAMPVNVSGGLNLGLSDGTTTQAVGVVSGTPAMARYFVTLHHPTGTWTNPTLTMTFAGDGNGAATDVRDVTAHELTFAGLG